MIKFKIVLESASASLFCYPLMCLTSVVYLEIYASGIVAWKTMDQQWLDPGGFHRSPTEAPFSPTLIYQFKLKYIYYIQVSANDSTNANCNYIILVQFYYSRLTLALDLKLGMYMQLQSGINLG